MDAELNVPVTEPPVTLSLAPFMLTTSYLFVVIVSSLPFRVTELETYWELGDG